MNFNIAGNPEDSADAIEAAFGEALHAPKRFLIMRDRKRRSEYYQSLGTNWSATTWTRSRDAATGFATEGEAEEFNETFRLGGEVVPNVAINEEAR
jgi:hypothetical protein